MAQRTRFDIAHSVSQVARHMAKPCNHHSAAVKRVVRHLKGKPNLPLIYSTSNKNRDLKGYWDSSYGNAGVQGKLRSTTGTIFFLANGLVHFTSSLQRIMATSTTAVELIAPSKFGKVETCLFHVLRELGWHQSSVRLSTRILKAYYIVLSNANFSTSSKYLAIRFINLKGM